MRNLEYSLRQAYLAVGKNKKGAFSTEGKRWRGIRQIGREIEQLGHRNIALHNISYKHINKLIELWHERDYSPGTFQNRMSHLRFLCREILLEPNLVASNATHGVPRRKHDTAREAWRVTDGLLDKVDDPFIRANLLMMQWFGLRVEESLKFSPYLAANVKHINMKGSWCKGGRCRDIAIIWREQNQALAYASDVNNGASLIPSHKSYIQQRKYLEKYCERRGIYNLHGLRHGYARRAYRHLTSWDCPHEGGPDQIGMSVEDLKIDREARETVHQWLGHGPRRADISRIYLGGRYIQAG